MIVNACILAHNLYDNGRAGLFAECLASLAEADAVYAVDNGSADGTGAMLDELVKLGHLAGVHHNTSGVTTCGHGTNLAARYLAWSTDADVCVLSDEDMWWKLGWRAQLERFWNEFHTFAWLAGCHLEPEYAWNEILAHGPQGLWRRSTGAASWSFLSRDWHAIDRLGGIAVPTTRQGWYDVPFCNAITERGGNIAQLDLAEHRGEDSTWGNRTVEQYGWDVEPVRKLLA